MSALTRVLFPLPDYDRTPRSLFLWWEARRPTFNLFVGGAGLLTLTCLELVSLLPPALPAPPFLWRGVLIYGVLANVSYTGGFLAELAMRWLWREKAPLAGPALFRQGLSFAIGLTLLPIPLFVLGWLIRLAGRLF